MAAALLDYQLVKGTEGDSIKCKHSFLPEHGIALSVSFFPAQPSLVKYYHCIDYLL